MEVTVKIRFLLLALYDKKYDSRYQDVESFFAHNGIALTRAETKEILETLEKDGLVKYLPIGEKLFARITMDGVDFLEENDFFNESTYIPRDRIQPLEREILRHQLEELVNQLAQSELREVVPAEKLQKEMEELLQLLNILGRKSWVQIFKGKLFELCKDYVSADKLEEMLNMFEKKQPSPSATATV